MKRTSIFQERLERIVKRQKQHTEDELDEGLMVEPRTDVTANSLQTLIQVLPLAIAKTRFPSRHALVVRANAENCDFKVFCGPTQKATGVFAFPKIVGAKGIIHTANAFGHVGVCAFSPATTLNPEVGEYYDASVGAPVLELREVNGRNYLNVKAPKAHLRLHRFDPDSKTDVKPEPTNPLNEAGLALSRRVMRSNTYGVFRTPKFSEVVDEAVRAAAAQGPFAPALETEQLRRSIVKEPGVLNLTLSNRVDLNGSYQPFHNTAVLAVNPPPPPTNATPSHIDNIGATVEQVFRPYDNGPFELVLSMCTSLPSKPPTVTVLMWPSLFRAAFGGFVRDDIGCSDVLKVLASTRVLMHLSGAHYEQTKFRHSCASNWTATAFSVLSPPAPKDCIELTSVPLREALATLLVDDELAKDYGASAQVLVNANLSVPLCTKKLRESETLIVPKGDMLEFLRANLLAPCKSDSLGLKDAQEVLRAEVIATDGDGEAIFVDLARSMSQTETVVGPRNMKVDAILDAWKFDPEREGRDAAMKTCVVLQMFETAMASKNGKVLLAALNPHILPSWRQIEEK